MPSSKKIETTALIGLAIQLVCVGLTWLLYLKSGVDGTTRSIAVQAQTWFFIPGILVWAVVFLHGRQRRLVREEREELEDLKKTRLSEELFEEQELDRMRAHSALVVFERFLIPAISIVFSGVLIYLAVRNVLVVYTIEEIPTVKEPLAVAIGMAALAFFGFLVGRYAVGLAQHSETRLLRASGAYLLGNVVTALLLAFSMALVHFGINWLEVAIAYAIPGFMGLVGVEVILNLILDIYRPRVPGREPRPPYDSRLLGLITEPGSVLKTVSATLDYQFGFKVSETWFYRFMARAIIPLFLIQMLGLWLLSCLVIVEPHEIAFIERFGRPRLTADDAGSGLKATVYRPGYYVKLPWPFEVARHVPAHKVYTSELGKIRYKKGEVPVIPEPEPGKHIGTMSDENVILWTERHIDPMEGFEADFMVPSAGGVEETEAPEGGTGKPTGEGPRREMLAANIARLSAYIYFRVKTTKNDSGEEQVDERAAYDFYYRHAERRDPEEGRVSVVPKLVEHLGYAAMCRLAASQDFLRWVNVEREEVSRRFAQMLQEELDKRQAGVEVVYAGIPSVHPPAEVAREFEAVIKAYQGKEKTVYEADKREIEIVNRAEAEAIVLVKAAEGYSVTLRKLAQPAANRFETQLQAYRKAPKVYQSRKYLSSVE